MLIDPAVVVRARAGDAAAFNQIVQACRKPILGTIRRLIGNADDVEDVAQEVFVRVYYSLDQLRSDARAGFAVEPSRLTVAEFADHWVKNVASQKVRVTTLANYKRLVKRHITPHIGGIRLENDHIVTADGVDIYTTYPFDERLVNKLHPLDGTTGRTR